MSSQYQNFNSLLFWQHGYIFLHIFSYSLYSNFPEHKKFAAPKWLGDAKNPPLKGDFYKRYHDLRYSSKPVVTRPRMLQRLLPELSDYTADLYRKAGDYMKMGKYMMIKADSVQIFDDYKKIAAVKLPPKF